MNINEINEAHRVSQQYSDLWGALQMLRKPPKVEKYLESLSGQMSIKMNWAVDPLGYGFSYVSIDIDLVERMLKHQLSRHKTILDTLGVAV